MAESGNRGSLSFDYDERRQLIRVEGVTREGGSPQEFNYSFDPIGNWVTGAVGDAGADEPVAQQFTANAVNKYTQIEVLGGTVMPEHDINGNVSSNGQGLTMAWDQENRLSEVRTAATRSVLIYDGLGKRVERREYATSVLMNPRMLTETVRYVYDSLLPVEERIWNGAATGAAAKVRKLTRGLDLSGTLEGAEGIGGLLALTSGGQSTFYFSDGKGNVTHLFDAVDQARAEYKHDPFGNRLAASGPLAEENA